MKKKYHLKNIQKSEERTDDDKDNIMTNCLRTP